MKHGRVRLIATISVLALLAVTGCGGIGAPAPRVGSMTDASGTASPGTAAGGNLTVSGKVYDLPEPCALLTRADAETALAEPVRDAFSSSPGASPFGVLTAECGYEAASNAPAINRANIGVTVRRYDTAAGARVAFDAMDRGTPGTERKVSGLGDGAFVSGGDPPNPASPRPRGGAVLASNLTLELYIALVKGADPGGALTTAMRAAVDRLPAAPAAVTTETASNAGPQASPTPTTTQTRAAAPATTPATAGTGQAAAASGAAGDVCALLTKQEVATALGEVTKDPQPVSTSPLPVAPGVTLTPSACGYDAAGSPSHLTITVYRSAGASAAQSQQFRQIICGSKEPVPDLGEVACWYSAQHREIQVFKGNAFLDIEMVKSGIDTATAVQTLARQALARLP